jgi:AhpD family alkylhydroperoxidase
MVQEIEEVSADRIDVIGLCRANSLLIFAHESSDRTICGRTSRAASIGTQRADSLLFTEKYVADKSELARRFIETRARLNTNVDKANNFLVKRFYNIDRNTYLEGALSAKTKELMGLVASACLRCDDCIFYHAIQAYRLGVPRVEQEESLNVAMVVGGSIVIPHLRRAYELLEELYG